MIIKRVISPLFFLFALFLSSTVFAQGNIAVFDVEKAIFSSDFAKKTLAELENSENYKSRVQQFQALSQELADLQKQAQTNSLTWSEEQKSDFDKDLRLKAEQRQLLGQQLDKVQLDTRRNIQKQLGPRLEGIVKQFVEEKKIDVLLNAQTVVYKSKAFDVTDEIVQRVNAGK